MSPLWPQSADPPDAVLVAAYSSRGLLRRWLPTTSCLLHLVWWTAPERARQQAIELLLGARRRCRQDGAVDFEAVLSDLIVADLTGRFPGHLDRLAAREVCVAELVAALRATSPRDQLLLCLLDDSDDRRHELGRFNGDELGRLFGLEPEHVHDAVQAVRRTCAAIVGHQALEDGLTAIRPAVGVGAEVAPTPAPPSPRRLDPLGADDPDGPIERRRPAGAAARRRVLAGSVAIVLALVSVGAAITVNSRGGEEGSVSEQVTEGTPVATMVSPGEVHDFQINWGPNPGVCPDGQLACYSIAVELDGYSPERPLRVTCVVADRESPGTRTVASDGDGAASIHVPCMQDRTARSILVTVDGAVGATVDLPTKIVPTPTVRFTNDRRPPAGAGCDGADCRFVDVVLAGFEPQRTVTVTCLGERTRPHTLTTNVTIRPDGTGTGEVCSFGATGERFRVVAGDVSSETIIWPGDG